MGCKVTTAYSLLQICTFLFKFLQSHAVHGSFTIPPSSGCVLSRAFLSGLSHAFAAFTLYVLFNSQGLS